MEHIAERNKPFLQLSDYSASREELKMRISEGDIIVKAMAVFFTHHERKFSLFEKYKKLLQKINEKQMGSYDEEKTWIGKSSKKLVKIVLTRSPRRGCVSTGLIQIIICKNHSSRNLSARTNAYIRHDVRDKVLMVATRFIAERLCIQRINYCWLPLVFISGTLCLSLWCSYKLYRYTLRVSMSAKTLNWSEKRSLFKKVSKDGILNALLR